MSAPATTGQLTFDGTGESIDGSTTAAGFSESPLMAKSIIRHEGATTRVQLFTRQVHGQAFEVTVHFEGPAIRRVELTAHAGKEGQTWAHWSLENEMTRKKLHESWARQVFAKEMEVKPFFTPNRVLPFEVTDETTRYAQFAWGQVVSWYDSKGSSACLSILYGAKDPA